MQDTHAGIDIANTARFHQVIKINFNAIYQITNLQLLFTVPAVNRHFIHLINEKTTITEIRIYAAFIY